MTPAEILAVLLVAAVCGALLFGYPVALTLGGVSLIFAVLGYLAGVMDFALLGALPQRVFGVMTNDVLVAVPLFIFMGVMLERAGVAEALFDTIGRWFGRRAGGLGFAVTVVGALLAASTGIVGATAVTMGLIVLPTMLRYGYDPRLAAGTVAASATLAQIIPPSTVLVVLGDQLNNAYQAAQLSRGVFAPEAVSVGDLFAGALVPGLGLVVLYLAYQIAVAVLRPQSCPPAPAREAASAPKDAASVAMVIAPLVLIVAVLGSILGGLATPTEAAAVGAVGAILLAATKATPALRWPVLITAIAILAVLPLHEVTAAALLLIIVIASGVAAAIIALWRAGVLRPVMEQTARITSMIFLILIGATLFSLVFRGLGGDAMVHGALTDLPGGTAGAIIAVMLAMFLLGFVMDAFEIVFVVVPIVAPALLVMEGVDPIWLGVLMALNLQTSYMHPPLGPTLFYLRGVAPPQITTAHIYVGIVPFVLIQLLALVLLWFLPGLATALPHALYAN